MKHGKTPFLLLLLTLLLSCMAGSVPAGELSPSFTVHLPESCGTEEGRRYPVLYLLPERPSEPVPEDLVQEILQLTASDSVMDMILVCPDLSVLCGSGSGSGSQASSGGTFTGTPEEIRDYLRSVADEVDASYDTAADPKARMIAGFGSGGMLALFQTWADADGKMLRMPDLFGLTGCISGDFTSEDNPWLPALGSFRDVTEKGPLNNQVLQNFYTYLSSATEDPLSYAEDGADAVLSSFLRRGPAFAGSFMDYYGNADDTVLSLSLKNGADDDAFRSKALREMLEGFSKRLIRECVSADLTLSPQAATEDVETVTASAEVVPGQDMKLYSDSPLPSFSMQVSLLDPQSREALSEAVDLPDDQTAALPNLVRGDRSDVVLTCNILGMKLTLDTAPLVRIFSPDASREETWFADLSGTWKFLPAMHVTPGTLPGPEDTETWEDVIPGLSWWSSDFSDKVDMKSFSGYAWYSKTFTAPEKPETSDLVLSLGYFDETDVVFLNGTQIGCTGMNPEKWTHQEDCWDTERVYPVDPSLIRFWEENTVLVLTHNQSGDGGWYSGHPMLMTRKAYEARYAAEDDAESRFLSLEIPSEWKAKMEKTGNPAEQEHFLVYLPEGYDLPENADRRYPVIWLLHQLNSTSHSYVLDGIDSVLDEAISEGELEPSIVIIPDSAAESWWMYGWDSMVTEELLPYVDTHFRTIPDPRFRIAAGASMGGHGAFYIAYRNPGLFSHITGWYGAINMGGNPLRIASNAGDEFLNYFTQYFICGNRDLYKFGLPSITLDHLLREAGAQHFFELEEGEHASSFYLPYAAESLAYHTGKMPFLSEEDAGGLLTLAETSVEKTEDGTVHTALTFDVDSRMQDLLPQVPDADAPGLTTEALTVPVRVTVKDENGGSEMMEGFLTIAEGDTQVRFEGSCEGENLDGRLSGEVMVWILNQGVALS